MLSTLVNSTIESIECCSAFRRYLVDLIGLFDEWHLSHALAEVAFVDAFAKNGFVEHLQLSECKEGREKLESHRMTRYALAQYLVGLIDHFRVVKEKGWHVLDIFPIGKVFAVQLMIDTVDIQKSKVCDGNHAVTRVSVYTAECSYLTHVHIFQTCQCGQYAGGSVVDIFVQIDESTHERPFSCMRLEGSLL